MDAQVFPAASMLQDGLSSLEAEDDPRRIVLRACAQFTGDFTIVVDNLWLVTDELIAQDLLSIVEARPRVSIVVITRSAREIMSIEDEIAIEPVIVGPEALAFTPLEVAEALELAGVSDSEGELASTLVRVVNGNPLLVRGVIQAVGRGDSGFDQSSLPGTVRYLGNRLLRELVLPLAATHGDGLKVLYCSVPEVLTAALVQQLTEQDGAELLARFERDGLGVWSREDSEPEFTLSPLVRAAWKAELEAKQPEMVASLSLTAAVWCLSHDRPMQALRHAVDAGAYDLANTIVTHHWAVMLRKHGALLLELLDGLPARVLLAQPVLAMVLALSHNAIGLHRARALELLVIATQAAGQPSDDASMKTRAINSLIECSALRVLGRGDEAIAAADKGRKLVDALSQEERDSLVSILPVLLNNAGLTYLANGKLELARDMFESAVGSAPMSRDLTALHSRSLLAGLHAIRGGMNDAEDCVSSILIQEWPKHLLASYHGALLQVAEARLAIERFDYAAALRNVDAMAPHLATIEHWPMFAQIEAISYLGQGELQHAITVLESRVLSPARPASPAAQADLDATRALLQLAAGSAPKAEALLAPHAKSSALIAIGLARLELLRGRPEQALQALLGVQDVERFSIRHVSEISLLQAAATLRLDRAEASLTAIDSAVALMSEHGLQFQVLLLSGSDRDAILSALEQRGPSRARDFMLRLADRPSLIPESVTVVNLSDRELIVLRALAANESLAAIASSLFVSRNTVKSQVQSVYRKLGVSGRDDALLAAAELGLLE